MTSRVRVILIYLLPTKNVIDPNLEGKKKKNLHFCTRTTKTTTNTIQSCEEAYNKAANLLTEFTM